MEGVRGIGVRGVAEVAEREPERLEPIVGILLDGAGEVGAAAEDGADAVRTLGDGDGDAGGGQDDRLERGRAHVHREDALARVVGRRDRARGSRRAAGGEVRRRRGRGRARAANSRRTSCASERASKVTSGRSTTTRGERRGLGSQCAPDVMAVSGARASDNSAPARTRRGAPSSNFKPLGTAAAGAARGPRPSSRWTPALMVLKELGVRGTHAVFFHSTKRDRVVFVEEVPPSLVCPCATTR